jgi:hypothetical protein
MKRSALALTMVAIAWGAGDVQAQFPTDTLDVRGVLAWFRTHGNAAAVRFLTQHGQRHSQRELDELADSLVAIAVSWRSGDPPHRLSAARAASTALGVSGLPVYISELSLKLAERGLPPPVRYQHAFDKLVEVLRRSEPGGYRAARCGV